MQVTVLGGGNVALATAVMLSARGHDVRLWSALREEVMALADGIEANGALQGRFSITPIEDISRALAGTDAVVLSLPAFAHASVMEAVASHLANDVPVIVHPATGLTTLLLDRWLRERGRRSLLIDLSTSLAACRRAGEARIHFLSVKDEIDLATLPTERLQEGLSLCRNLFGDRFASVSSILGIALNNHNPVYHLPPFLANLTRIERAEEWIVWEMMTPGVVRLIESVDRERMAVAEAYGVEAIPLANYVERSYGIRHGDLVESYRELGRKLQGPLGPQTLDHRFLTEDGPYALALFARLGYAAGLTTPSTGAFLHLAEVLMEAAGWRPAGVLDHLGLDTLSPPQIAALCRFGHT